MTIQIRQGRLADSYPAFRLFMDAVTDLGQRTGVMTITGGEDPQVLQSLWETRRPMFEHLARTADQFWVAESEGQLIGYARSILRGNHQELTEYFVQPGQQSAGIGKALFDRAFPKKEATRRSIVATLDDRALARYLKARLYPRFPLKSFAREPEAVPYESDLEMERVSEPAAWRTATGQIDRLILGYTRPEDHAWIRTDRQGYLYRRGGQVVGYGYVGRVSGPFALLEAGDFPTVLAHAETQAAGHWEQFGVETPLINTVAVDYLLERGFRMGSFTAVFMTDQPFGQFENYLFFAPPFFL